jgi:hypothetical protein
MPEALVTRLPRGANRVEATLPALLAGAVAVAKLKLAVVSTVDVGVPIAGFADAARVRLRLS